MERRVDGSYKKKEVDRTAKDVIIYLFFLSGGEPAGRMAKKDLASILTYKARYTKLDAKDWVKMFDQLEGWSNDLFKIYTDDKWVWVK